MNTELEQFLDALKAYLPTVGGKVTGSQILEPEGTMEVYTDLGDGGASFSITHVGEGVFDAMWDGGTGEYDADRLEKFKTPQEMLKAFGLDKSTPQENMKANQIVKQLLGEAGGEGSHPTMNVGQLIALLQRFPEGTPVYYGHTAGDYWRTEIAGSIKTGSLKGVEHSDYHQKMKVKAENPERAPRDEGDGGYDEVLVLGTN